MKNLFFETEKQFDESGIELCAIYTKNGEYICDVTEEWYEHMLDAEEVEEDQQLTEEYSEGALEKFKEEHGVEVIIGEEILKLTDSQMKLVGEFRSLFKRAQEEGLSIVSTVDCELLAYNGKHVRLTEESSYRSIYLPENSAILDSGIPNLLDDCFYVSPKD